MARIFDPPPAEIIVLWPQVEPLLKPLLAKEGNYEAVDVLVHLLRGEMKLWLSWDGSVEAVMITQIQIYPRKKVCYVPWIVGTNMAAWKDEFEQKSEAYAREMGCTRMLGAYRKGWIRAAGYEDAGVLLKKDLT